MNIIYGDCPDVATTLDVMRRKIIGIAIATATVLALMGMFPTNTWAELKFCNRTQSRATVAIAYVAKDPPGVSTNGHLGVTVEGWWTFEPNECARVGAVGDAGNHWVYYHGHAPDGGQWSGSALLCVPTRAFTIRAQFARTGDACSPGRRLRGFVRANPTARNHTINLRNP